MIFEEEKQRLESLSQGIDTLENQIQSFLYEKDEFMLRRKRTQVSPVQCGMVFRDLETQRHDLLAQISNYAFKVRDCKAKYDEALASLHYIQYQMYERMDVLKMLLATSQTENTTVESIFQKMDEKFSHREEWIKEISQETRREIEVLKAEDEEKARLFIATTASELSNALLKDSLHHPDNQASWKEWSFDNYPNLKEAISETQKLLDTIVNLQIALCILRNQL